MKLRALLILGILTMVPAPAAAIHPPIPVQPGDPFVPVRRPDTFKYPRPTPPVPPAPTISYR